MNPKSKVRHHRQRARATRRGLVAEGCTYAVMEGIGSYWKPVFNLLDVRAATTTQLLRPACLPPQSQQPCRLQDDAVFPNRLPCYSICYSLNVILI